MSAMRTRASIKTLLSDGESRATLCVGLEPVGVKGQIWNQRSLGEHKSKVFDEA
jgi:hypothetical protein